MSGEPTFYLPAGDGRFDSTPSTAGPWGPESQHGGPPAALLARAIELCDADAAQRLARLTVDILQPLPVAPLTVSARVLRPGRRVTLLEAQIEVEGRVTWLARGWRIQRSSTQALAAESKPPPALPERAIREAWEGAYLDGYMSAMEWRPTLGLGAAGPGAVWARPRLGLLPGEALSPFQRAALLADSASGVSLAADLRRWMAINVDLTVALRRDPAGEWLHLASHTQAGPDGTAASAGSLADQLGPCGDVHQTLIVAPR